MDKWIHEFAKNPQPREITDRLGDYLIAHGIIDRFDLNWAMRVCAEKHKPLGEVLVELELATPLQVQDALEEQLRRKDNQIKLSS